VFEDGDGIEHGAAADRLMPFMSAHCTEMSITPQRYSSTARRNSLRVLVCSQLIRAVFGWGGATEHSHQPPGRAQPSAGTQIARPRSIFVFALGRYKN
jgi:hypothetical protein